MNFSENLAYWYLRLNGFFPLRDFVLHRDGETIHDSADCDLLAIWFPYVYEQIGGQENDWDSARFGEWGLRLEQQTIGLIVEVKTGRDKPRLRENIKRSFTSERLLVAVRRLGFWSSVDANDVARKLSTVALYRDPIQPLAVAKLLITDYALGNDSIPPCLQLALTDIEEFLFVRADKYDWIKHADQLRFPDELIQYIFWNRWKRRSRP